jgi:hypothetical protein
MLSRMLSTSIACVQRCVAASRFPSPCTCVPLRAVFSPGQASALDRARVLLGRRARGILRAARAEVRSAVAVDSRRSSARGCACGGSHPALAIPPRLCACARARASACACAVCAHMVVSARRSVRSLSYRPESPWAPSLGCSTCAPARFDPHAGSAAACVPQQSVGRSKPGS